MNPISITPIYGIPTNDYIPKISFSPEFIKKYNLQNNALNDIYNTNFGNQLNSLSNIGMNDQFVLNTNNGKYFFNGKNSMNFVPNAPDTRSAFQRNWDSFTNKLTQLNENGFLGSPLTDWGKLGFDIFSGLSQLNNQQKQLDLARDSLNSQKYFANQNLNISKDLNNRAYYDLLRTRGHQESGDANKYMDMYDKNKLR